MGFNIEQCFRKNLPVPAAAPFKKYPKYNFVGGHIDGNSIPVTELINAATATLQADGRNLATYGLLSGPQGHRPLREFIANDLKNRTGMADSADNVLLTSGSLQALDLVNDLLLEPGDVVITEEATYGGAIARLRNAGVICRGVRMDQEGIDMDHLEALLSEQEATGKPAKFIYSIPTVQNPTGGVMSLERRRQLLAVAEAHDCLIFEDDCYADLLWGEPRPPTIRSLDQTQTKTGAGAGRVIYCGSFSKSIAPALRVGYLVADWPVIAQILPLKTDAGSGALEQLVLAKFCEEHFIGHIDELTQSLRGKCETIIAALEEHFGSAAEFDPPKGGIFIWITLPPDVDTSKLAVAAQQHEIAINPGADWTVDGPSNRHRMRLCFGHPDPDTIREGVAKLAQICHQEFGIPKQSGNVAL